MLHLHDVRTATSGHTCPHRLSPVLGGVIGVVAIALLLPVFKMSTIAG